MKFIKIILVTICLFLTCFSGCINNDNQPNNTDISNSPADFIVNIDGSGDFVSIQDAIDASKDNDSIYIFEGVYVENLLINKSVNLIGADPDKTIIDGNFTGNVIHVVADNVIISNVTFQYSGSQGKLYDFNAGVFVDSNSNQITNCIFRDNHVGILIHFRSYNEIEENNFYNNSYGIYSTNSTYNAISNNTFQTNSNYGIYLYSLSHYNYVQDNVFLNNIFGLRVKGNNNFVIRNVFQDNDGGLYFCCGAWGNIVYHNTFLNNSYYKGKSNYLENYWFKDLPVGGNYWLDYDGVDADGDGFGDSSYIIHERNNSGIWQKVEDKYPLMEPIVIP